MHLQKFIHRKIRRKADQGNISKCREKGGFSCSIVSLLFYKIPLRPVSFWSPHPNLFKSLYNQIECPIHKPHSTSPPSPPLWFIYTLVSDNPYRIQDWTCFFLGPKRSTTFSVFTPFGIWKREKKDAPEMRGKKSRRPLLQLRRYGRVITDHI